MNGARADEPPRIIKRDNNPSIISRGKSHNFFLVRKNENNSLKNSIRLF